MGFYGEEDEPRTRASRERPARARRRPRRSASVVWHQYARAPVPFDDDDASKTCVREEEALPEKIRGRII